MNDSEVVRHIAEKIMGWHIAENCFDDTYPQLYERGTGEFVFIEGCAGNISRPRPWNPLSDLNACAEFEAKLIETDKVVDYLTALERLCCGDFDEFEPDDVMALVHATPRQRCLAAEATK